MPSHWAATCLASNLVFLISFGFCFNYSFFLSTLFIFPQFFSFLFVLTAVLFVIGVGTNFNPQESLFI